MYHNDKNTTGRINQTCYKADSVAEDVFIWASGPQCSLTMLSRNTLIYLLTIW